MSLSSFCFSDLDTAMEDEILSSDDLSPIHTPPAIRRLQVSPPASPSPETQPTKQARPARLGHDRGNPKRARDVVGRINELHGRTTFEHKCAEAKRCWECVARYLKVPAECFNHHHDLCFCSSDNACSRAPKRNRLGTGGTPHGWTRFSLTVNETICETRDVFSHWPKCYHGTTVRATEHIVRYGKLLMGGSTLADGTTIGIREGHIKTAFGALPAGHDDEAHAEILPLDTSRALFFSPSIKYAAHGAYAERVYIDRNTFVVMVLECRLHPDYYSASSSTVPKHTAVDDPFVKSDAMEWSTPYNGVHYVTGLLVKVCKTDERVPASRITPPRFTLKEAPACNPSTEIGARNLRCQKAALQALARAEGTVPFNLKCEYAKKCFGVLSRLVKEFRLDPRFFNHSFTRCNCNDCLSEADRTTKYRRGGKPYRVPRGFLRVGLQLHAAHAHAREVWHHPVCYHGSSLRSATWTRVCVSVCVYMCLFVYMCVCV